MNLVSVLVLYFALLSSVHGGDTKGTINHDQVKPFAQPEPITISEKAAVKFKPQLSIGAGCVSFPAVNAAGEITGGLKGTKDTEGCTEAPLGSQVYGRSAWYQDKWAMMYAWYFPKNFCSYKAASRHDWANIVLWIDNPALETPTFLGLSLSQQTLEPEKLLFFTVAERKEDPYHKQKAIHPMSFAGTEQITTGRISRWNTTYKYVGGSNITTRFTHTYPDKFAWIGMVLHPKMANLRISSCGTNLRTKHVRLLSRQISGIRRFLLTTRASRRTYKKRGRFSGALGKGDLQFPP